MLLVQHAMCKVQATSLSLVPAVLRHRRSVQVADALDDVHFEEMLRSVAFLLQAEAIKHSSGADADRLAMSEGLSKLPVHLQHRVLEHVMSIEDEDEFPRKTRLDTMLELLPVHHHDAVLAAAITPDKALVTPQQRCQWLPSIIRALAQLQASPPSILSLELHCDMSHGQWKNGACKSESVESTAAAGIAAALRHHSRLTSLRIAPLSAQVPVSLQPLAEVIATLTSLQALHLCSTFTVQAWRFLEAILMPLHSLQELSLLMDPSATASRPQKRARENGTPPETPQLCISSLLSSITSLTRLEVASRNGHQRFTASAPLHLPCLSHLKVTGTHHNLASALLSHLTAPLSTLQISDHASSSWRPRNVSHTQQLLSSLPRFEQLSSLAIDLDVKGEADHRAEALSGASQALASFSSLQELSISADVSVLVPAVTSVAASADGLQRLQLICGLHGDEPTLDDVRIWWSALLTSLSRVTLRHLDVRVHPNRSSDALCWLLPGMREGVHHLTHLTALHLFGWRDCLWDPRDSVALTSLQQLQSLCLQDVAVTPVVQLDVMRALRGLPSLTQLALRPGDRSAPRESERWKITFPWHAPAAAWRSLRWLGVAVHLQADAESAVESVSGRMSGFSSVRTLELQTNQRRWRALNRARMDSLASDAGVCLKYSLDWERFAWKSAWA